MLDLKPACERCAAPLPPASTDARICSFECTFCAPCTDGDLAGRCPNCGGDLQVRPARAGGVDATSPRTTVARYAQAWSGGDLDGVLASYAPDVAFHYAGRSGLAGDHVGLDAALAAMAAATVRTDRELVAVDDVLGGDALAALVVRERLGGRDGTERREVRRVLLYRTENDRLRECWLFDEDQRFVDELWGPERP